MYKYSANKADVHGYKIKIQWQKTSDGYCARHCIYDKAHCMSIKNVNFWGGLA